MTNNFLNGGIGIFAGAILFFVAGLFFSSTQYVYPGQAAVWFWIAVLGLAVTFISPIYFWIIRPVSGRIRRTKQV